MRSTTVRLMLAAAVLASGTAVYFWQATNGAPAPKLNHQSESLLKTLDQAAPPRIQLLPESTGKSYRTVENTADGTITTIVWDTNSGGAIDREYRTGGTFTRFTRSTSNGRLVFEAVYKDGQHIAYSRRLHSDGSVDNTYVRAADGGGTWTTFSADGKTVVEEIVKAADGAYTRKTYAADKPATVTALERQQFDYGSMQPDTSKPAEPVLRVWMLAGRIDEWQWQRADGKVKQHGKMLPTGELSIELWKEGILQHTQVYTPVFEDWAMSYWRLNRVEANLASGKPDKTLYLNTDGVTLSRYEDFNQEGRKNWVRYYDGQGMPVRQDTYDSSKAENPLKETKDMSADTNRSVGTVPGQYLGTGNSDTGGPLARLASTPFEIKLSPTPDAVVGKFFIEPGKAYVPPAPVQQSSEGMED